MKGRGVKGLAAPLLKRLKFAHALAKSFREFLSKTAIHSYHYLVEKNRHVSEKVMWSCLHLTMSITAIYIVLFAWSRFTDNPTITQLESQHHSIFQLEFPAVAFCTNNKISRTYAERYADHLLASPLMPRSYRSKERIVSLVRYMGRLYDADIEGIDEFAKFQEILDLIDSNKTTGIFDTRSVLESLAPKCEDFILDCKYGGAFVDCKKLLDFRRTNEGFCCTYNYVKQTEQSSEHRKPISPVGIGSDMGLTILLNLSSADYFYPLKNTVGSTIIIFDPQEFPDSATGGCREVPIEPYTEVRVTMNVKTKIAVPEVQRYGIDKRECMFPSDLPNEWYGNYVYGDCLVKCKLRSVLALCKCKLYNIPTNFADMDTSEFPYCSLSNIECLNKYRIKWGTYRPREHIVGLEREMEDSLSCENCYPLCSMSTYIVDSTSARLNFHYINKGSIIAGVNESNELSVVKVYFPQIDSTLYTTTVLYAWYDIISDYGGILSLCLGCSIISIIELLYFITVRFYQNLFNSTSFMTKFNQRANPNAFTKKPGLYRPKLDFLH